MIRKDEIQLAISADQGATFSEPSNILNTGGRIQGGADRGPQIAVDNKGFIIITAPICLDPQELKKQMPQRDLWLFRSVDGGKKWSKPVRVNEIPKKAGEALHSLAVAKDGTAHIVWLDARDNRGNSLWYARCSDTKVGRNLKLAGPVCECCAPDIAVDHVGNPTVVVREAKKGDRGIVLLRSENSGKTFGTSTRISPLKSGVES
jgi:hypothetical protein